MPVWTSPRSGNWAGVDTWLERSVDTEAALIRRCGSRARFDGWRDEPRWLDESRPLHRPDEPTGAETSPTMMSASRSSISWPCSAVASAGAPA